MSINGLPFKLYKYKGVSDGVLDGLSKGKVWFSHLDKLNDPYENDYDYEYDYLYDYEDEDIVVVNKPKDMVVHPSAGHLDGTLERDVALAVAASNIKELYPDSNPCGAIGDALGYTQTEKMAIILNDVCEFAKDTPIEAVLVLGDLSTDDCGYRRMAENYVQKFKDEVMLEFPCVSYALPGNHELCQEYHHDGQ